jgi:hypothetical protein
LHKPLAEDSLLEEVEPHNREHPHEADGGDRSGKCA